MLITKRTAVLHITPAERATLQLLADGRGTSEIAVRLRMPECRIDQQLSTLFEKLGATNRTEAVAAAFKRGLVVVDAALLCERVTDPHSRVSHDEEERRTPQGFAVADESSTRTQ